MRKRSRIKIEDLSRFLVYILVYKPHEFGLVPGPDGFFLFKELLQAIHEEPGWGYVRQGHINEVLMGKDRNLFQFEEKRIRPSDRGWNLDLEIPARSLPKTLFTGIRRKAHPLVMDKGLLAAKDRYHVFSPEREMALRIGKRRDQRPVILEIMANTACKEGVLFYSFGDLFLAPEIPVRYIAGPPLPKAVVKAKEKRSKESPEVTPDFRAGTFLLRGDMDMDGSRKRRGKKKKGWKEEARKHKKQRP